MTAHSVLNVRAAPEWGNSELYKYYERNGLGYGTVQDEPVKTIWGSPAEPKVLQTEPEVGLDLIDHITAKVNVSKT